MTFCYLVEPNSAGAWHGSQRPEGEVGLDGPEASRSSKRRRTHSHGSEGHENRDNLYLAEVTQRHRAAFVSSQRRWTIHPITANRIHAAAAITD